MIDGYKPSIISKIKLKLRRKKLWKVCLAFQTHVSHEVVFQYDICLINLLNLEQKNLPNIMWTHTSLNETFSKILISINIYYLEILAENCEKDNINFWLEKRRVIEAKAWQWGSVGWFARWGVLKGWSGHGKKTSLIILTLFKLLLALTYTNIIIYHYDFTLLYFYLHLA